MGGGGVMVFRGGDGGGDQPVRRRPQSNYQFGGNYIVFVMRGGKPTALNVRTGLTDLEYSEIVNGLTAKDTLMLLPSASLVASQDQFKQMMSRATASPLGGAAAPRGPGR